MQRFQQGGKSSGRCVVVGHYLRPALRRGELLLEVQCQLARLLEVAAAEAEAQHGMPHRPVPPVVDGEPLEQRLVALEQLLAGVQEQALAEAPRARQEVVLALVEQPPDIGGLVDVVAVALPDLAEGLHADGQLASSHGHAPGWSRSPWYLIGQGGRKILTLLLCSGGRNHLDQAPPSRFSRPSRIAFTSVLGVVVVPCRHGSGLAATRRVSASTPRARKRTSRSVSCANGWRSLKDCSRGDLSPTLWRQARAAGLPALARAPTVRCRIRPARHRW